MKKREYLSLGGLFIALHLVFILLSRFLPGSSLLLVIFLPLLSAVYTLKFNKKEVAMFLAATLFLCLIFEPISALIYVVPALICGVSYGILKKKNIKELTLVYASSVAHSFSLLVSFLFISLLFKEVEFFDIFSSFIKKEGAAFYCCIYLVLVVLGLIEAFILHLICDNELEKLGYERAKEEEETPNWILIGFSTCFVLYVITMFIAPIYTLYLLPFVIAFIVPIIVEFITRNKRKWIYILCGGIMFFAIFLMGIIDPITYPILLIFSFLPVVMEKIVRVLYTFCLKYSNKRKNIIE